MVKVLSHLLLHYPIASDLWAFLFCLNEISWLTPNSVVLMLESWDSWGGRKGGWWACLMLCIWGERNRRIFKDKESTVPNLKFLFFEDSMNGD